MQYNKDNAIALLQSTAWKELMVPLMDNMVKAIEQRLFTVSPEANKIKFTEHDLHRMAREYLLSIISIPEQFAKEESAESVNRALDQYAEEIIKQYSA